MNVLKLKSTLLLFLLFTLTASSAIAQSHRGLVRGRVTDQNNAALPGATATLTSKEIGVIRTATTNDDGEFIIASVAPGEYKLTINAQGFLVNERLLTVLVNQEQRVDVLLGVAGHDTVVVDITDDAPLKSEGASLSTVIENRSVVNLPLDGRNFFELSLLVPGAVPPAQGSAGSVRGDFSFSVNGAREDSNNFLLDGVYNVDPKLNTFAVRPPVDAIREFEMATSSYDATFGRNPGAQVNVVTKSGTNEFHGSLYEFHRNGKLDARNFFAPASEAKPKYIRNQFGGALGGPIAKDRTFFFVDYEGGRSREGITRITNVPTAAERSGNFSQSLFGVPRNPFTGMPFDQGRIPDAFIHPVGRAIAALYPLPNRNVPLQNFVSSPTQSDDTDTFDVRVDHRFSGASQFVARYSFGNRDLFEPFTGPTFALVPGFGDFVERRSQNLMIGETHIFSPTFVNEARFAFSRVASAVTQEASRTNRDVGLPVVSPRPRDLGLSFITITGFSPLGDEGNNPQNSVTNVYQFLDNASYIYGSHLFKFGVDIRFTQQNAFRDVESRGRLQFSPFGQITGNALGDLLLGFPFLTTIANVDNPQQLRTHSYNFFIDDSFRATPRLTLNFGLRYEYNSPAKDAAGRSRVYDVATGVIVTPGTGGIPEGGHEPDRNNFAPRVGFAWTVGEDEATVLRAGYGVYYDQSPLAPGEALYFNAPLFDNNIFFSLPGLPLTLSNPFPSFFPFPLPDSALAIQRDLRTGYMQHWNANIQRLLGPSRLVEIAYVGSKGTKLLSARDINQPRPSVLPPGLPIVPRPNPRFDDIDLLESRANSSYHSMQARFQQRWSQGLSALASYTWSKSLDEASNFFSSAGDANFPQNSYDLRSERGRSNFDVRHRLSVSYGYDLPFGRNRRYLDNDGWVTALLSGWQTFGVLTLQTGRPFTVALLPEIDNSGTGRSLLGFGANDRPNLVRDPRVSNRTTDRWFDTTAFAFPPRGTFGNAGRNILDGPGFQNFNASLVKNTSITERLNLQFRGEVFNVFNHPNFGLPDNFLGSPTFGRITTARDPRHIQFGLKLLF